MVFEIRCAWVPVFGFAETGMTSGVRDQASTLLYGYWSRIS